MSADPKRRTAQRHATDLERAAAKAVGSTRTARVGSRTREPDVAPINVRGCLLAFECKHRRRLPRLLVRGLAQARGYVRGSHPVLIVREPGAPALVVLGLELFCELAGIAPGRLPVGHVPTRRPKPDARQFDLFGEEALG